MGDRTAARLTVAPEPGPYSPFERVEVGPEEFLSDARAQERLGMGMFAVNRLTWLGFLEPATLAGTKRKGVTAESVRKEALRRKDLSPAQRLSEILDFLLLSLNPAGIIWSGEWTDQLGMIPSRSTYRELAPDGVTTVAAKIFRELMRLPHA